MFPNNDAIFQDDSSPIHTARSVQSWLKKHQLEHLSWPAQSPNLDITEPMWSVLECTVKIRFPPPSSLKQLEDVLQEEWYNIPVETILN
jgi:hypothetical protein